MFIFSTSWIINFFTNYLLRNKIEKFVSDTYKADDLKGPIFDYFVDTKTFDFSLWAENSMLNSTQDTIYNKVFIPLIDNIPYLYIAQIYIKLPDPIFYMGKPSTGKSLMINKILNDLDKTKIYYYNLRYLVNYSSSSKKLDNFLSLKLEYVRKNLIGDLYDRKVILFIDDINHEKYDKFGTQSCIEYIRQINSQKFIFDMKTNVYKKLNKFKSITCGNISSQVKNHNLDRYLHSTLIINQNNISDEGINSLFKPSLEAHLKNYIPNTCAIRSFQFVQVSLLTLTFVNDYLKPSPNRVHYKFSLRDISRIFQGIHFFKYEVGVTEDYSTNLVKLWFYETSRVFEDRLINKDDKKYFQENLLNIYNTFFK